MTLLDRLTPAERHEIQSWFVRVFHARRRRRLYDATRVATPDKRYDLAGRLVAVAGRACEPHVSSWAEDRPTGTDLRRG